jgi:hypothetical protein
MCSPQQAATPQQQQQHSLRLTQTHVLLCTAFWLCSPAGTIRTANNFNQLSQFKGCGYAVADNAFLGLVDTSVPPRVVAEASYNFAHEAPVYLPALKQVWAGA